MECEGASETRYVGFKTFKCQHFGISSSAARFGLMNVRPIIARQESKEKGCNGATGCQTRGIKIDLA